MKRLLANLFERILGPSDNAADSALLLSVAQERIVSYIDEKNKALQDNIVLLGILHRPNELIKEIRDPLKDAITKCMGEPIMGPPTTEGGDPEFLGMGPHDIIKVKKAIEVALEACQKAIKEQSRGVEEVSHGS